MEDHNEVPLRVKVKVEYPLKQGLKYILFRAILGVEFP